MVRIGRLACRLLLVWLLTTVVTPASIQETMEKFVADNKISQDKISLHITDMKTGAEYAAINADQSRVPASIMKVLTTYTALKSLGPTFRWPTKFYYHGTYRMGVISGDLIVKAYGDPTLSLRDVARIAKRLRKLGVKKITGDLIIDRSFFSVKDRITSGFDKNRYSQYNAMPDAIMYNDHLSRIYIKPKGNKITVYKAIPDRSFEVVNHLVASPKKCKGAYAWPRIAITSDGKKHTLTLSGEFSRHCSRRSVLKVLTHSYYSFFYAMKQQFSKAGILFYGGLRLAKKPEGSRALFTHYARPLTKIVAKTNKKSNNLYARHLMLLTGAKNYGAPATVAKGQKAVEKILRQVGALGSGYLRIYNGSGLSRTSRIDARTMTRILRHAYADFGKTWLRALSIAGVDGTIRRRFKNSAAKGRAWMKTGTLNNAKNIAGYVRSKTSGRLYSVVIIYNGPERWKGSLLQNQIINWLAQ